VVYQKKISIVNIRKLIKNVYFLVLNSNYLKICDAHPEETKLHETFIEKDLIYNRAVKTKILLMHHPLYFEDPDEKEEYFSLPPAQRKWVLGLV